MRSELLMVGYGVPPEKQKQKKDVILKKIYYHRHKQNLQDSNDSNKFIEIKLEYVRNQSMYQRIHY